MIQMQKCKLGSYAHKQIELESPGWSGFEEKLKGFQILSNWDILARFIQNLHAYEVYEPNMSISICNIFVFSTVSTAVFV